MIERYVAHCMWMAERDPAYAARAAKAYGRALHAPEIPRQVLEALMGAAC